MNKDILKSGLGWGLLLWLIGYILGFALFFVVPPSMLGWIIMPIGTLITLWVLYVKVPLRTWGESWSIALVWVALAGLLDYLFIVKLLNPPDGYYKLDVYLYYILTFLLPLIVGWWKRRFSKIS